MTTFNVSHCRDVVLGDRGAILNRLVFRATVNWSVACRVFGQHTTVYDPATKGLPCEDGIFPESTAWQTYKVFDEDLVKKVDDDDMNEAPWSVLKEDNTISVLFVEMGVELSLSRVHMAEAMFDVAKQRSTTQAWELTVSQPVTAEGEPCDAAGKPRYDQSMFSRFLSSWMYWTSKSRDYWVNQKIKKAKTS